MYLEISEWKGVWLYNFAGRVQESLRTCRFIKTAGLYAGLYSS